MYVSFVSFSQFPYHCAFQLVKNFENNIHSFTSQRQVCGTLRCWCHFSRSLISIPMLWTQFDMVAFCHKVQSLIASHYIKTKNDYISMRLWWNPIYAKHMFLNSDLYYPIMDLLYHGYRGSIFGTFLKLSKLNAKPMLFCPQCARKHWKKFTCNNY